jgi:hypothetical protein
MEGSLSRLKSDRLTRESVYKSMLSVRGSISLCCVNEMNEQKDCKVHQSKEEIESSANAYHCLPECSVVCALNPDSSVNQILTKLCPGSH